jgi:hypothetical protein
MPRNNRIICYTFVVFAALLAGCASMRNTQPELNAYVAAHRESAFRGEMKWSDYYNGLRTIAYSGRTPNYVSRQFDLLLLAAVELERGAMKEADFLTLRRNANNEMLNDAREAAYAQERQQAQSIAVMQVAAQLMAQSAPRPMVVNTADYDWDWDEQYDGANRLVWVCRGVQSGQYAEPSRCGYKMRTDIRWPSKYAN